MKPFVTPTVMPRACPIGSSLGVLGRKWALLVLRDAASFDGLRFSDFLALNRGLTPRMLTFRLRELEDEGYLARLVEDTQRGERVTYALTAKGRDVIPILAAFTAFGFKHHAGRVFADGAPRTMSQMFPGRQTEWLGELIDYASPRKTRATKA